MVPDATRSLRLQIYVVLIVIAAAAATGRILSTLRAYDPENYRVETEIKKPHLLAANTWSLLAASGDRQSIGTGLVPYLCDAAEVVLTTRTTAPTFDDGRSVWPRKRPGAWPTFGSNDRSRFTVVRALVDEGTWVIGRRDRNTYVISVPTSLAATNALELTTLLAASRQARIASDSGIITEDGWGTIDRYLKEETLEYYSTKPPLLTLLAAGEYWALKHAFGLSIVDDCNTVVRIIVWTFNVPLFVIYLALLARLIEKWGKSDWGRLFTVAAACFGTLVTPFLNTFNNHTIATAAGVIALYAAVRILTSDSRPHSGWFLLGGLFAGLTVCNEMPAAALATGLFLVLVPRCPWRTLLLFLPAAVLPVAALFITNHMELGQWRLAYTELNGPGYQYEGSIWRVEQGYLPHSIDFARLRGETVPEYAFHLLLGHHGWFSLTPIHFLGLAGMLLAVRSWRRSRPTAGPNVLWCELSICALLLFAVVFGFYLRQDQGNYGGVSAGARWLIWMTPLWLLAMVPVVDWLGQRRWGRVLGVVLLFFSVPSASYPTWSPWRHPWIYNWLDSMGRIPY